MQMTRIRKTLSLFLGTVLIAATALTATGCNDNRSADETASQSTAASSAAEAEVIGQGEKSFAFTVSDKDGNESRFTVNTDKAIVGEALEELGIISGDEGEFGLYVKTVNGITLDFDRDGMYWAFYVNGEYASAGVDATEIDESAVYSFKAEK